MKPFALTSILLANLACGQAFGQKLIEPQLTINTGETSAPHVALTFDACSGQVDQRILQTLIDNKINATIFVTARWLKRNPTAVETIKQHQELFEIENHGANHVPAVDFPTTVFSLKAAGSPQAVRDEVQGGAQAIEKAFGGKPVWFRGATGHYTAESEKLITAMNFKIAGYSLIGDGGASFSTAHAAKVISQAQNGDVIVAHMNQPLKPAGAGVVEGILKLKTAGFVFVKLNDGI